MTVVFDEEQLSLDVEVGTVPAVAHRLMGLWRVRWPTGRSDYFHDEDSARAFRRRCDPDSTSTVLEVQEIVLTWAVGDWCDADLAVAYARGRGMAHFVSPDPNRFLCGRVRDGDGWQRVNVRELDRICRRCNERHPDEHAQVGS